MGPRRRRWRRRAAQAALAALGLAALGLAASGAGEELLAAALAAWGERRGAAWGDEGGGLEEGDPGEGIWGSQVGIGGAGGGVWGSRVGIGGAGGGVWGSQVGIGGAGGGIWGPGGETGGPGVGTGGPGDGIGGSEAGIGGAGGGIWGSQVGIGRPGAGTGGSEAGIGSPEVGIRGSQVGIRGPGVGTGGPGVGTGGPGAGTGGSEAGIGGPGVGTGGPGVGTGGPGAGTGGSEAGIGGPGGALGGPAAPPPPPPACSALLLPGGSSAPPGVLLAPAPCSPLAPFLLTLVPSAPSHLDRRQAVRETWGSPWQENSGTPPTRTVFVLGAPRSPLQQRRLVAESRQHGDILQGDFADAYANLTRKTLLLLRWARACCPAAPFLLKADDDVFVHAPAVATYLAAWPSPPARLYLGRVHWRVAPARDPRSRHHVPAALFAAARYPPYCSGTAYVLSRQAAAAVLREAPRVPLALPEDVWVGLCAGRAGLRPRHWARFGGSWRVPGGCAGRAVLSAHRLRPREMREIWEGVRGEPQSLGGALGAALGVLRCRLMGLGEWLWGGGDVTGE